MMTGNILFKDPKIEHERFVNQSLSRVPRIS